MMHAAEAATLNDDGSFKKTSGGQSVKSNWEKKGDAYIWQCNDPNLMPYKNANNDIFPEFELKTTLLELVGALLA